MESINDLINFINAFDDPYVGASTFLNNNNKKSERLFIKNNVLFNPAYIKNIHYTS